MKEPFRFTVELVFFVQMPLEAYSQNLFLIDLSPVIYT